MMPAVRTTITLDEDVAVAVQRLAAERGWTFKTAVNSLLRAGLAAPVRGRRYRTPSRDLGLLDGVDLDSATHLAAELEDAEIVRKLELRK
jgi:Arc/MetJ family transcription regulator